MRESVRKIIYRFIKNDGLTVVLSGFILAILVVCFFLNQNKEITSIIDLTIFSSIIVAMTLNSLAKVCEKWVLNRLEDKVKLTSEYDKLMLKYQTDFYCYHNKRVAVENPMVLKKLKHRVKKQVYFPVTQCFMLKGCQIEIEDRDCIYQIPDELKEHFDELFSAHNTSKVYNQLCIRVDCWRREGNIFHICTSRTTYYSSLVTNRAMDFPWNNGLTVRDVLEHGPWLHELTDSRLSNHLGFSAFIISLDDYVPFVKRNSHLSIGKNTFDTSISASLKPQAALDQNRMLNREGLMKAVICELREELKIHTEELDEFVCSLNLIAAYRDLVEGGKPQLVFLVRSNWSREKIQQHFFKRNKNSALMEKNSDVLWIHKDELPRVYLDQNKMIYNKREFAVTHSAAASLGMFIEYTHTA